MKCFTCKNVYEINRREIQREGWEKPPGQTLYQKVNIGFLGRNLWRQNLH